MLRDRKVSLCVAESEKFEVPEVITADFVYYRLRKPDYTDEDLQSIEARVRPLLAEGPDLLPDVQARGHAGRRAQRGEASAQARGVN